MKTKTFFILAIIILLNIKAVPQCSLFISTPQKTINDGGYYRYWINIGFGSSYFGPTLKGAVSVAFNTNIFSVRYLKADEFTFNPASDNVEDPTLRMKEIAILYGQSISKNSFEMGVFAGMGYLNGTDRGRPILGNIYDKVNISQFGLAFEVKFRFSFGLVGIGGTWIGNLNSQKTLSCDMLEIYIGKL